MKNYIELLKDIKQNGVLKESRAGDTLSVFGRQLRWDMSDGFPLMTLKKVSFHNIAHELLWFLGAFDDEWKKFGNTNIRYLVDHNVNIWNDDAFRGYVEKFDGNPQFNKKQFIEKIKTSDGFALEYGELGDTYGAQWRRWGANSKLQNQIGQVYDTDVDYGIDQIQQVIDNLKNNPMSRRHLVSAWNVGIIDTLTLPPCHWSFQLNVTGDNKLSLMYNLRSQDAPLGFSYNCGSYSLLLYIICHFVNMEPDEVIVNLGDTHIYTNQLEAVDKMIEREDEIPNLPTFELVNMENVETIDDIRFDNFKINDYHPLSTIKAPLSVGL